MLFQGRSSIVATGKSESRAYEWIWRYSALSIAKTITNLMAKIYSLRTNGRIVNKKELNKNINKISYGNSMQVLENYYEARR